MIALITGASAGIGKELATEFAKDKINLVLVARREEKMLEHALFLETTYGVKVSVIHMDLAAPIARLCLLLMLLECSRKLASGRI